MLTEYTEKELKLAGFYDEDADCAPGEVAGAVLGIVRLFEGHGHSGASAGLVLSIVNKVLNYEPLSPITSNPAEWMNVTEYNGVEGLWQSVRKPTTFSKDGGKTWYDLDDLKS